MLVGIYGNSAGTYVNQVGASMRRRWTRMGAGSATPSIAGSPGSRPAPRTSETCPREFAISGFRGRSAQYVDQLDFECRALTSTGKVTGAAQYLGPVGGTGGTAQGPYSCGTGNPVYALTGRSGSWLDAFGMQCRQAPITTTRQLAADW